MHEQLSRQLGRLGLTGRAPPSPEQWAQFLSAVEGTYSWADRTRYMLERSIEISSAEMSALNDELRRASDSDTAAQRDRLQAVMSAVDHGLCVIDQDGRVEFANGEAERLLVRDGVRLEGRRLSDVMRRHTAATWRDATGASLELGFLVSGRGTSVEDCILLRADGSSFAASYSLTPLDAGDVRSGAVLVFRDVTARRQAETLQRAMRRIAEGAARAVDPRRLCDLIAHEVARVLDTGRALVARVSEGPSLTVLGIHALDEWEGIEVGAMLSMDSPLPFAPALRDACAAGAGTAAGVTFRDEWAVASIHVGSACWAVIIVELPAGAAHDAVAPQLERIAQLAELAVVSSEARSELLALATSDPLTGIANHRAFREHLQRVMDGTTLQRGLVGLVLFDLDNFKDINDGYGHPVGDAVLKEFAHRLAGAVRAGDFVARIGGEEFAWAFVAEEGLDVWALVDRVRRDITSDPFPEIGRMTVSAGACTSGYADSADALVRLADGALYWAKRNGRDLACLYSPESVEVLSPEERADRLQHRQALQSIRALARAVDAKGPLTRQHSDRVAGVARLLANVLGWSAERSAALHEAGLVHDVGKIGVSDAVLFKVGRLSADEYAKVQLHSALGAEILTDILTPEQVAWVRGHHERIDGRGYPDGLAGDRIPTGARILAVADAWDAITVGRPYQAARGLKEALAEMRAGAGIQFCPEVVDALERVITPDVNDAGAPRLERRRIRDGSPSNR